MGCGTDRGSVPDPTPHGLTLFPSLWFATDTASPKLRLLALRDSPAAFKKRNLFTPAVDLPLALRAGRPVKSAEEKRRNNAERQRRFRARRQAELEQLMSARGKR